MTKRKISKSCGRGSMRACGPDRRIGKPPLENAEARRVFKRRGLFFLAQLMAGFASVLDHLEGSTTVCLDRDGDFALFDQFVDGGRHRVAVLDIVPSRAAFEMDRRG